MTSGGCDCLQVELFLKEFFDQNPISQVSIVAAQDRVAKKLTELSGSSHNHHSAPTGANAVMIEYSS